MRAPELFAVTVLVRCVFVEVITQMKHRIKITTLGNASVGVKVAKG